MSTTIPETKPPSPLSHSVYDRQKASALRRSRWYRSRFLFATTALLVLAATAAFIFSPWSGVWATQATPLPTQIDNLFKNEVAQHHFSGSVLIARNGQILLEKGYSLANRGRNIANTPDTRFYLGSVTKEFTAASILILQQRGKLKVTDHLCKFVAHCPAPWKNVTLHELLTHTSGIPDLNAFNLPRTSLAAWFAAFNHVALEFPAGSRFHYCNTCYKLLAYVVQQASGVPYAQFQKQNIFTPVQMSETDFNPVTYYSQTTGAIGYASWGSPAIRLGATLAPQWSFLEGSGLLYTSVKDLYRWDQSLYAHTVLTQQSQDAAYTPYVTANLFADSKYGYGWFISHSPIAGHPLIWHDGVIDGFRTYIGRYIKDHITIIFLSNLASVDSVVLAHSIQKLIFA